MAIGTQVDVVVAGAGAAGLAAARDLSQSGLKVLVLEARGRIGGRIYTVHDRNSPTPIELGAEFIHGEPEETFAIVRAASLAVDELPNGHYWSRNGKLITGPDIWDRMIRIRKALHRFLKQSPRRDVPVSDFLASSALRPDDRIMFQDFVEGYHAGYPERLSGRWVAGDPDEEGDSDAKQFRVAAGYDGVIHALRSSLDPRHVEVRLSTVVTGIEWARGKVAVSCRNGIGIPLPTFHARAAVITLPVPVLRAGTVLFDPKLEDKDRALRHLEGGQVFKMVLRFREAFWNDETFLEERIKGNGSPREALSFVHAPGAPIPTWWTSTPARSSVITAWAGGPRADMLLNQEPGTQITRVLDALASAWQVPRSKLDDQIENASMHDWRADPFSRAAYTYVGVGGSSAQGALAKPVAGTLFFAGEATDSEQTGTVAGAIASGQRAAKQLRDTLQG